MGTAAGQRVPAPRHLGRATRSLLPRRGTVVCPAVRGEPDELGVTTRVFLPKGVFVGVEAPGPRAPVMWAGRRYGGVVSKTSALSAVVSRITRYSTPPACRGRRRFERTARSKMCRLQGAPPRLRPRAEPSADGDLVGQRLQARASFARSLCPDVNLDLHSRQAVLHILKLGNQKVGSVDMSAPVFASPYALACLARRAKGHAAPKAQAADGVIVAIAVLSTLSHAATRQHLESHAESGISLRSASRLFR